MTQKFVTTMKVFKMFEGDNIFVIILEFQILYFIAVLLYCCLTPDFSHSVAFRSDLFSILHVNYCAQMISSNTYSLPLRSGAQTGRVLPTLHRNEPAFSHSHHVFDSVPFEYKNDFVSLLIDV